MKYNEAAASVNSAGAGLLLRKAGYVGLNEFASLKAMLPHSFRLAKSDFDREFAGGALERWLREAGALLNSSQRRASLRDLLGQGFCFVGRNAWGTTSLLR